MTITLVQMYIFTFMILIIGGTFGFIIGKTEYRRKHRDELESIRKDLEKERAEKATILMNRKHDIAHAVTDEWNRGYTAAFSRLKHTCLYIHQWEKEHGIEPGEMETIVQEFEKQEEEKL